MVDFLWPFHLECGVKPLQSHPLQLNQSHTAFQVLEHQRYLSESGMVLSTW